MNNRETFEIKSDLLNGDIVLPSLSPRISKLDNGIDVYAFENKDMEVIKLEFFFRNAGTIYQNKIYSSIITNNQISEGSSKHKSFEIANAIDFHGAFIEKTVDKETSSINFYFLKKYQDNLLPWFEEIIKDAIFPEYELNIYIQKLKQQYLVNQMKTDYLSRIKFNEMIFGENHPFGVIGTLDDYDKLSREDLIAFYHKFYNSNECSIIVAGDINGELLSLINKYFGKNDWQRDNKDNQTNFDLKPIIFDSINPSSKLINLEQAVQASIRIGRTTISSKHDDFMGLNVLNCLLGGYFGSRLMSNIREDKGYTYGIGSALYSYKDIGMFYVTADVKADKCQNAIDEVYKEIDSFSKELVPIDELNAVKNFMIGSILRSLDGSLEISDRFRPLLKYGFDYDYYKKYINTIKTIDSETIINLAKNYLSKNSMSEIRVGNETIIQ